jgi:hypothetical protein
LSQPKKEGLRKSKSLGYPLSLLGEEGFWGCIISIACTGIKKELHDSFK